jgi:hypothetical protein
VTSDARARGVPASRKRAAESQVRENPTFSPQVITCALLSAPRRRLQRDGRGYTSRDAIRDCSPIFASLRWARSLLLRRRRVLELSQALRPFARGPEGCGWMDDIEHASAELLVTRTQDLAEQLVGRFEARISSARAEVRSASSAGPSQHDTRIVRCWKLNRAEGGVRDQIRWICPTAPGITTSRKRSINRCTAR